MLDLTDFRSQIVQVFLSASASSIYVEKQNFPGSEIVQALKETDLSSKCLYVGQIVKNCNSFHTIQVAKCTFLSPARRRRGF